MNCAVVNITNKRKGKRDSQASAAKALSRYPDLFVANLAGINSCKTQETTDVIFDTPGNQVSWGNGDSPSMKPSFGKGQCTGKGSKGAKPKDTPSSNPGGGSGGQWTPPAQNSPSKSGCANKNDGFWHPECYGGNSRTVQQQNSEQQQQKEQQPQQQEKQQLQQPQSPQQDVPKPNTNKPNTNVQQELDAYLATLYGRSLARRNIPAADYANEYDQKKHSTWPASSPKHTHTEGCKHEPSDVPSGSHYRNEEDLDPYPEDGVDYSNKNIHSVQDSQYDENPGSGYKRTARQKRWTSYTKRADGTRTPIQFHRGDESAYYQQQTSDAASAQTSALNTAQVSDDLPVQKSYYDMTPAEQFEAFLRRMVELSNNVASLIKYAAASTVSVPYYPPVSTYGRTGASTEESAQNISVVRRHARRDVLSSTNSPNTEDGSKAWFPDLVQGLVERRQLVDPVTSEASADAGDSVNFFDALLASFVKAFGDPFNIYGDDTEADPVPTSELELEPDSEALPLTEPDSNTEQPDIDWNLLNDMLIAPPSDDPPNVGYPDFDIPDLDGHYTFPPQVSAPPPPLPELLPGYEEGPNGPVWVGEGPDPLGGDWPSTESSIIISIDPIDGSDPTQIYPGSDIPTISCVEPIPQVGFNSCWGGCNHTASEIAAHDVYLANFAEEQAQYEECLKQQASSPTEQGHGVFPSFADGLFDDVDPPLEAPDASDRRPRPGMSHPLIPYPLPENFTGPFPANETAPIPLINATAAASNETAPLVELQPYQNKTLGELVTEILNNPDSLGPPPVAVTPEEPSEEESWTNGTVGLTPVPSDSSDDSPPIDHPSKDHPSDATNPLQEAANEAEEGVTIPQEPVSIDPNALKTIADALPWFMGPGPVVTSNLPAGMDDGSSGILPDAEGAQ